MKRNQWPLAVVKRVFPSSDGLVRFVEVKTVANKSTLTRPVNKLVLLIEEGTEAFGGGV